MLVYDLRASGVVRNVLRIAEAARDAGLDARLWPVRLQGDMAVAVPDGVPVEPILHQTTARQRDADSLLAVPAIARAIEGRAPALFFSGGNQMHLHAALAMRRVPFAARPRFVGRASNAVLAAGGAPWRRLARPVEAFQYGAMDRVVAVSEELAGDLVGTLGLSQDRVSVIPNGVDVSRIERLAAEPVDHRFFAEGEPPVVLGVGRLSRQKNFEALVRAFAIARRSRPLRLVILGPGSAGRQQGLAALAERLGVADSVDLAGYCANPFAFMARAGLTVLTSRWEGASNVLLEAMACGCPVVAVRAPTGIAEVLDHGRVAPLVEPGDDQALAAAMLDRLAQPRGSEALRARAEFYLLDRTMAAYARLLAEELDTASAGRAG